ncbi:polycystin-1 isoform X2 [Erpetoichthys calabaricus]|uniref:polycystin-1 isoform X2 n=1 Tax=Erpetoichthys calabaricus TaxID=27687 RepID=UPI0022343C0D|nr:polycystin-1 isoform X2 [Erpetoichthys calabaricus]
MTGRNGQAAARRKHGVCLVSSLLVCLPLLLDPGPVGAELRCRPCPTNCTCEPTATAVASCSVNCSRSGLERGPDHWDIPSETDVLDLSHNSISSIDASLFEHLTSLKELYLQGNNLSNLPYGIFCLKPLSILDLSNNQISTLGVCSNLFNLSEINLSFNPFVCECQLLRFVSWIAENRVTVHQAESTQCATPADVQGVHLLNVSLSRIMCDQSYVSCQLDEHTGKKELVIYKSVMPGNFTKESCNALCVSTRNVYGAIGQKNECLCSNNFETNLISEAQCSSACSDTAIMHGCGWTLAEQPFLVSFLASLSPPGTIDLYEVALLNISISAPVSALLWDFGDDSPQINTSKRSVAHKYALPGKYRINVTLVSEIKNIFVHTEINVAVPERWELRCPVAVVANHSIDISMVAWDGPNRTVQWWIVPHDESTGQVNLCSLDDVGAARSAPCYQLVKGGATLEEAQQNCSKGGAAGRLAVLRSPQTLAVLAAGMERDGHAWIDFQQGATKDGRNLTNEEAACFSLNATGHANPTACSARHGFICEYLPEEKILNADYFMEGTVTFDSMSPFATINTVTSLGTPSGSIELLRFPGVSFRQEGALASVEFVTCPLNRTTQVRFQLFRPHCEHLAGLHLALPGCGEACTSTSVCQPKASGAPQAPCPPGYQWCQFTADCLPLRNSCRPSLCSNCSGVDSPPAGALLPELRFVKELLLVLPPGGPTHYLAHVWGDNITVLPGDTVAVQHDADSGSLIDCHHAASSPWRQDLLYMNLSEWTRSPVNDESNVQKVRDSVCNLRFRYTSQRESPFDHEALEVGLPTQGEYTFYAQTKSRTLADALSCTFQVVAPLALTVVYPTPQEGIIYVSRDQSFILVKVHSKANVTAHWDGGNQTFTFTRKCPAEAAHLKECAADLSDGTQFAVVDLDFGNSTSVSFLLIAEDGVSRENLTLEVKVEDAVRGLRVLPDPNQRVLVNLLVSYTAQVDAGSDVSFRWTVDDKPSFTYYNTVLNVIYQNAAVYKLSVTAMNHVSNVTEDFNVTVDMMWKMSHLTVTGIPDVAAQNATLAFSARVQVDSAVEATFRWIFGDGGNETAHVKPPYGTTLDVPQAVVESNVTYAYREAGEYTLTLIVSNHHENLTYAVPVSVRLLLTDILVEVISPILVVNQTAVFSARALPSSDGVIYTWSFGDDSEPFQGQELESYVFQKSGPYNVSVRANNTVSWAQTKIGVMVLEEITGLAASSSSPTELHTETAIVASVETGNDIRWTFDMGDGTVLSSRRPSVLHRYVKEANYTVNVSAANAASSSWVTLSVEVFVLEVLRLEPSRCIQQLLDVSFVAFVSGNSSLYVYDWNFGDGSPNLTVRGSSEVAHLFENSGLYHLSLALSSSVNKANFFTSVCVEPLIANVSLTVLNPYTRLGEESRFSAIAFPDYAYSYVWDFGANDSSLRGSGEVAFTYQAAGRYVVTVTVLNNISSINDTGLVEVQEPIGTVGIEHNGTKWNNLTVSQSYTFTASGDRRTANYTWDFGDGTVQSGPSVTHAYEVTGLFNVSLVVGNDVSSSESQVTVAVRSPIRDLKVTASRINVPLNGSVCFEASHSAGDNIRYSWILCDRCTPINGQVTISYTFRSIGTFNIIVTAENDVSSMQASIFIYVLKELEGLQIVTEDLVDGCCIATNRSLQLQAVLRDGTNMSYAWVILRHQTVVQEFTSKVIGWVFPEAAPYEVVLRATNLLGSTSVNRTIDVLDPVGSVTTTVLPNPVKVNGSSTVHLVVSGGTALYYTWPTEDQGMTVTNESQRTYKFAEPGLKVLQIVVANKVSCKNETIQLSVQEPVVQASFVALDHLSPYYVVTGSGVTFLGAVQMGTNLTWLWNLQELTLFGQRVTHQFSAPGVFTVTLNVSNDVSWAIASENISVQDKVEGLELKASKNIAAIRENVLFMIGISSGTSVSFLLTISGDSSVLFYNHNYTHQFTKMGNFIVNLTAQNQVSMERTSTTVCVMEPVSRLRIVNCCEDAIPVGVSRIFSAETQTGSPLTFLWTFDLHSGLKQTIIGKQVSYMPLQAGPLTIYLSAFNALGSQNITRELQAQNRLVSSAVEARPADTFVNKPLLFHALALPSASQVSYLWNFGDGSDRVRTTFTNISHAYLLEGNYTVEVNASNLVSFVMAWKKITIRVLGCDEPEVVPVLSHIVLKRSQGNYLEAAVDLRGCTKYDVTYLWEIYRSTTCANCREPMRVRLPADVRGPQLVLPKMSLDLGSYCVLFSLSYVGVPLTKTIAISLSVVPSRLVPIIDGGTFRVWSKTQNLVLNGDKSYDPNLEADSQSPLNYSWACVSSSKTPSSGCKLNCTSKDKTLVIAENLLEVNVEYTFLLGISKPNMSPEYTNQTVLVKNGTIPIVSIECISCKAQSVYEVSQSSYIYLAGTCSNCQDNLHTGRWFACSSENQSLELNMTTTSTGRFGMNLVVRQGVLKDGDTYTFSLHVRDPLMENEGFASIVLRPNLPPAGGFCTIRPSSRVSALTTKVHFSCSGYRDSEDSGTPLIYSLTASRCSARGHCEVFSVYKGSNPEYSTFLPIGFRESNYQLNVSITVQDQQGAAIVALNQSLKVALPELPGDFQSLTHWMCHQMEGTLQDLLKLGDPQQIREYCLALITLLNEYEQNDNQILESQSERSWRVMIRSNVTLALVSLKVNTVDDIQQTSAALAQCTAVSREFICEECQRKTLNKLEYMLTILQNDTKRGTVTPTEIADNILNIMGDLIHVVNQKADPEESEDKSHCCTDQHQLLASKAYTLSSELMRILMNSRVLNEEPLVLRGSEITTKGIRADPLNLLCYLPAPGCPFSIPKDFNSTLGDRTDVIQVLFQVHSNPFPFSYVSNYSVSTEVASMAFQTEDGTQIPIQSLGSRRAIKVTVSNTTGARKVHSGVQHVEAWSSVTVVVKTGNQNKAAGVHIEVTFNLSDGEALGGRAEPYISVCLHGGQSQQAHNCTSQRRITLSSGSGADHKLYTFFISPEVSDTTADYYLNVTNECPAPVDLQLGVYTSLCQYFDDQDKRWKTDGMVPLEDTTPLKAVCQTEHLTAFGASLIVPPNSVQFIIPPPRPGLNYIVLLTCTMCFITVSVVIVIVCKLDLIDIQHVGVVPFCGKDGLYKYEIQVKTGWGRGSGTTAHVGISLYGSDGRSGHRHLDGRNAFVRNSMDIFHIATDHSLGNIWKIQIWHDNKGLSPSWFPQYVIVKDLQSGKKNFFLINDWLSVDNDDNGGLVEKEILAATDAELRRFTRIFMVEMARGFSEKHIWLSLWDRPARSRFTRVQRATCCAVLLFLFFVTNSLWYGIVVDTDRSPGPVADLVPLNGEMAAVGLLTCVLVYPVYLLLLTLFRMARSKASFELPPEEADQEALEIDDDLDTSTVGSSLMTFTGIATEVTAHCAGIFWASQVELALFDHWSLLLRGWALHWPIVNCPAGTEMGALGGGGWPQLTMPICLKLAGHTNGRISLQAYPDDTNPDPSAALSKSLHKMASPDVVPTWNDFLSDSSIVVNSLPKLKRGQGSRHLGVDMTLAPEEDDLYSHRNKYFTASDEDLIRKILADGHGQAPRLMDMDQFLSPSESELLTVFGDKTEVIILQKLNEPRTSRCQLASRSAYAQAADGGGSLALLPPWCSHTAHVLGLLMCAGAFGVSVWIGVGFSSQVALKWLISGIFSFLASFLVLEPLKVVVEALYFSLAIKRLYPEESDTLVENPQVEHISEKVTRVRPPQGFALFQAKEEAKKVKMLHTMLKNFLVYMLFLLVILLTNYGDSFGDTNARRLQCLVQQQLESTAFGSISKPHEFWIWLSETLLPYLYGNKTLTDACNVLLGSPRLRQVRSLDAGGSTSSANTRVARMNASDVWAYVPPGLPGVWHWGQLSIYDSGGFVKELGNNSRDAGAIVQSLRRWGWLDSRTRVVFLEFTLYNTNTDLYAVVTFLAEFPPAGGAYTSLDVSVIALARQGAGVDLLFVMMVFLLVFVIYFAVHEAQSMKRQGCSYLRRPWHLLQLVITGLSAAALLLHFVCCSAAERQWDHQLTQRGRFTDFYQVAFLRSLFSDSAAVLLFLLTLKAARQLRFLREWSVLGKTVWHSARELAGAAMAFTLVLLSFAQLGYLMFCADLEAFGTLGSATMSLLSVARASLSLHVHLPEQALVCLFYISYVSLETCIIIKIFAAVFIRNYSLVRAEMYRPAIEPQDYEMVELFVRRLKMWMGISKAKEFRHRVQFEGMEPLPSRSSSASKSLRLPTPDTASDISFNSTLSGQAESLPPGSCQERPETEANMLRLLPVFEALLLQFDRVNKVTEDVYQTECRLELLQRSINRSKGVQMTGILLNKYCLMNPQSDREAEDRKATAPSSLFRHPAHTATVPMKKRKPTVPKNKVHPNTDMLRT